jgi:hypothetical protein
MPLDHNDQSLIERVAELEAKLAAAKGEGTNDDTRKETEEWNANQSGLSEAAHGMAADALAMISQHQPSTNASISPLHFLRNQTFYKAKRLLPFNHSDSNVIDHALFEPPHSDGRITEILFLLPDHDTIHQLLSDFEKMQHHGLDMGISLNLIKVQLRTMEEVINARKEREPLTLDLSFVALLFHLIAVSVDFKDVNEVLVNMGVTDKDASYSFMTEGQRQDAVHEGEIAER